MRRRGEQKRQPRDPAPPKIAAGEARLLRVYLETSELWTPSWPPWSGRIDAIADRVHQLGGTLILPEPVEREAEEQYVRNARSDLTRARKEFHRVPPSKRVALEALISEPLLADVRQLYRAERDGWKKRLRIVGCPATTRSLDDLFALAIAHRSPFAEKKNDFQDAAIYFAVIEDLRRNPGSIGVLIAGDKGYNAEELREQEASEGIRLHVLPTDESIEFLEGLLSTTARENLEQQERRAIHALERLFPEIEEFVARNLRSSATQLALPGRMGPIESLTVSKVGKVAIARSGGADESEDVTVIFDAELLLQTLYLSPPRLVEPDVGATDDPSMTMLEALRPTIAGGTWRRITVAPRVEIVATAKSTGDGYRDFVFQSVRLRPWREWVRIRQLLDPEGFGEALNST